MANHYLDLLAYFGIGGAHPGGFSLTEEMLQQVQLTNEDVVLDLGCGTGQTAAYISEEFEATVYGLDQHPIMIKKAHNRDSDVTFLEGDAENLPFQDDTFTFVLTESTLAFTDLSATLKEVKRVLKPGGRCLFIEMTADQPLESSMEDKIISLYSIRHTLLEEEWKEQFTQAGFSSVETIPVPSELKPSPIHDMQLSPIIPEMYYDLWDRHADLVEECKEVLGFRVFVCH